LAKKKAKKQPPHHYIKAATILVASALLLWVGFGFYQHLQTHQTPPEYLHHEEPIAQIMAPFITDEEESIPLTFEDVLPEPVSQPLPTQTSTHEKRHQIALIIDDVGYDLKALRRLLALPFPLTVSILPDAPYAKQAAQMAYQHGVPVMLHMPMQTANPKYTNKMEAFYLHAAMNKAIFTQVFEDALTKVPHVVGINNHMGSALTANTQAMQWLMELCKKHGLFFIDSRTSPSSVAASVARKSGIAWNARDIFLDHSLEANALQQAWKSALSCARKSDTCIMLAHPHSETLVFLEQRIEPENYPYFIAVTSTLQTSN